MSQRSLNIGMVCPYGWDTPGGVQVHIRDLAQQMLSKGHRVSVLAPVTDDEASLEEWLVPAGRPIAIPYNGSIARVLFGPIATSRVRQWISQKDFDLLHLHEPGIPSLSMLACWVSEGPMVATFHASSPKQKAFSTIAPLFDPMLEKISARIAVSEMAKRTLFDNFGSDAIIIPNGIDVDSFRIGSKNELWNAPHSAGFIGRFSEARKGLGVILTALPIVLREIPDFHLYVAGPGNAEEFISHIRPDLRKHVTFVGRLSESQKREFMRSISVYLAPNTGGESFGIILMEALAAGAPVIASDIPAFVDLLHDGQFGRLFSSESAESCAQAIIAQFRSPHPVDSSALRHYVDDFDWSKVAAEIESVYDMVTTTSQQVTLVSESRIWNRRRVREDN